MKPKVHVGKSFRFSFWELQMNWNYKWIEITNELNWNYKWIEITNELNWNYKWIEITNELNWNYIKLIIDLRINFRFTISQSRCRNDRLRRALFSSTWEIKCHGYEVVHPLNPNHFLHLHEIYVQKKFGVFLHSGTDDLLLYTLVNHMAPCTLSWKTI